MTSGLARTFLSVESEKDDKYCETPTLDGLATNIETMLYLGDEPDLIEHYYPKVERLVF
ncbi:hypothetical protein PNP59_04650 [Halobacterium salinarum]|uniref:hypothetical protein n=1 Tax=Halobacterium salinarum TaxID=2242 RepID=UPI00255742F5|nr:hypothetical protein [Halobacterium salinarum]MDL0130226.1 hypothetical protein [Halobacterium salinarum]MDL0133153.1 hypothetical protein [Halobacterium salinarum]